MLQDWRETITIVKNKPERTLVTRNTRVDTSNVPMATVSRAAINNETIREDISSVVVISNADINNAVVISSAAAISNVATIIAHSKVVTTLVINNRVKVSSRRAITSSAPTTAHNRVVTSSATMATASRVVTSNVAAISSVAAVTTVSSVPVDVIHRVHASRCDSLHVLNALSMRSQ